MKYKSSGVYDQDNDSSEEDIDSNDCDSNSEDECTDEEAEVDYEQQGGNEGDIQYLRAILNRLRELQDQGEEDGVDEKILEVEQTLLEYEWENELIKQRGREKKSNEE